MSWAFPVHSRMCVLLGILGSRSVAAQRTLISAAMRISAPIWKTKRKEPPPFQNRIVEMVLIVDRLHSLFYAAQTHEML